MEEDNDGRRQRKKNADKTAERAAKRLESYHMGSAKAKIKECTEGNGGTGGTGQTQTSKSGSDSGGQRKTKHRSNATITACDDPA